MSIRLNSNIAALNAQRRLSENTNVLSSTFQRLSSGLRINHASDDASGLAISQLLNADARVYAQGVRNFNDGISLLNIAEGALSAASSVVIRIRELATQSANGTLTYTQRTALSEEANALVDEYNRIINSTSFNGKKLLDGSVTDFTVQGGYGADGQINLSLGSALARNVGSGTFTTTQTLMETADLSLSFRYGDYNGDGVSDFFLQDLTTEVENVFFGNGDGTFRLALSQALTIDNAFALTEDMDMNGDGKADIITQANDGDTTKIFFSNGDGSFRVGWTFDPASNIVLTDTNDYNGDGYNDVLLGTMNGNILVYLNNGDGTFKGPNTSYFGDAGDFVASSDQNGDGLLDVLMKQGSQITTYFNQGNNTFSPEASTILPTNVTVARTFDANNDGINDLLLTSGGTATSSMQMYFGRADGTFYAGATHEFGTGAPTIFVPQINDYNGDGNLDVSVFDTSFFQYVSYGNGDGSFSAARTFGTEGALNFDLGDINSDGVIDISALSLADGTVAAATADTTTTTELQYVNLHTQKSAKAAMEILDTSLTRINSELGNIGAAQSRISTGINVLTQSAENFRAAASQILDADVAQESATLVRARILQQASAAVLGQANQLPSLALLLLKN